MEKIEEKYEFINYIIEDTFEECKKLGWSKESSISKVIYEVEMMMNTGEKVEKYIILFELCYLAAKENIRIVFDEYIVKLKKVDGMDLFKSLEEKERIENLFKRKRKIIIGYEKNI